MKAVHESKTESNKWEKEAESILNRLLSGWCLIPMDVNDGNVSRLLSKKCGIDYLLIKEGFNNVYGVSSHFHYNKNDRTFIVSKADYETMIEASNLGGLMPHFTMQVYIDGNRILGLGLIETIDLLKFIASGKAKDKKRYYICGWDDLRKAGFAVMEYSAEEQDKEDAEDADEDDDDAEEDEGESHNITGRIIEIVNTAGPVYYTH